MPQADSALCALAAHSVRDRLGVLNEQLSLAAQSLQVERLHDLRVASRRLRTAIRMFRPCWRGVTGLDNKIARLTHALGDARDLDVQIEFVTAFLAAQGPSSRAGLIELLRRLKLRSRHARKGAHRHIERFICKGDAARLGARLDKPAARMRPSTAAFASRAVRRSLRDADRHDACLAHPRRVRQIHKMRIACKHLRYTLEVLAPLYGSGLAPYVDAARKAQTLLGDVHDCDVWEQLLRDFLRGRKGKTPLGIAAMRKDRRDERRKAFTRFVQFWEQLRTEKFWKGLAAKVKTPPRAARPKLSLHTSKGRAA